MKSRRITASMGPAASCNGIFRWVALCCALLLAPPVLWASEYYVMETVAAVGQTTLPTGQTATGLSAPSINDHGTVAFLAQTEAGGALYSADAVAFPEIGPVAPPTILLRSPAPSSSSLFRTFYQINNENVILGLNRQSNTEFLKTYSRVGNQSSQTTIVSGNLSSFSSVTRNYFENLFVAPSINNGGRVVFYAETGALRGGLNLACPGRCLATPNESLIGSFSIHEIEGQPLLRPQMADDGMVLYRSGGADAPLVLLDANAVPLIPILDEPQVVSDGFTTVGQQPGIADDGAAIVFTGSRGTASPGVFLKILDAPAELSVVRIAGEGVGDLGIEIGADRQTVARQIGFATIAADSRVGVIHTPVEPAGLENDSFTVIFVATPETLPNDDNYFSRPPGISFRATQGLFTRRVDIRRSMKIDGNPLEVVLGAVIPLIQVGDPVPGVENSSVTSLSLSDPIARVEPSTSSAFFQSSGDEHIDAGAHRVAFLVGANVNGTGRAFILRASRRPSTLLNVYKFLQRNPAPWGGDQPAVLDPVRQYDNHPRCTLGRKGCWITMLSMQHNYLVQRHIGENAINQQFTTPARSNDIFDANGEFVPANNAPESEYVNATLCPSTALDFALHPTWEAPNLSPAAYPSLKGDTVGFVWRFFFDEDDVPMQSSQPEPIPLVSTGTRLSAPLDAVQLYLVDKLTREGVPVALRVPNSNGRDHFLLAVGIEGDRIVVADPACERRMYLDEDMTAFCGMATYANFRARGVLVDPLDVSKLSLEMPASAEALITDSTGRRLGVLNGVTYMEIPGGTIFKDSSTDPETGLSNSSEWRTISISTPTPGAYGLATHSSTAATSYIRVRISSENGSLTTSAQIVQGPDSAIQQYSINIARGAGPGSQITPAPTLVSVPNVVGLAQVAATSAITSMGLVLGTVTQEASASVPMGNVISQTPSGGANVAAGFAVNLVVSTGPALVSVPDVVGLAQAAAASAITNGGLVVGTVTQQPSATVPAGNVISQSPTSGTNVTAGSAVNLVVSGGPELLSVPNVLGLSQSAATTAIVTAGLVVGAVTPQSSATIPAGNVINQNPTGGASAVAGSAVTLVISTGPTLVIVPSVTGSTQGEAAIAITAAGLIMGTITPQASASVPSGSVISQNPAAGASVVAGSGVNLIVSSGAELVTVPNVVALTQSAATTAIAAAGLVVGTVTQQSSASVPAGNVISQTPASGSGVPAGSAVNFVISVGQALVNFVPLRQATQETQISSLELREQLLATINHSEQLFLANQYRAAFVLLWAYQGDVEQAKGTKIASGSAKVLLGRVAELLTAIRTIEKVGQSGQT
jgi:beta-lactam-binding protein with PASTA domain